VLDLHSRRCVGFAMGIHHDAELARAALCVAIAVRGGVVAGVLFHTDYAEVFVKPRIRADGLRSWELLVSFSA
jgi:transposase InsO family protein